MSECTELHPITRARERFGMELSVTDLRIISRMIRSKESIITAKFSSGSERHLVKYKDVVLPVLYSPRLDIIITILPNCRHNDQSYKETLKQKRILRANNERGAVESPEGRSNTKRKIAYFNLE